jgi:hypothetical protein
MRARHLSMAGMGSNMIMPSEVGIRSCLLECEHAAQICWVTSTCEDARPSHRLTRTSAREEMPRIHHVDCDVDVPLAVPTMLRHVQRASEHEINALLDRLVLCSPLATTDYIENSSCK